MDNSIFRITLIFLFIFAVGDGHRRYDNNQGTVDPNDSRRSQDNRQQIVDEDDLKRRRQQDEYTRRDQDVDQLQQLRMHVRNTSQPPSTRDKRDVNVEKSRSQKKDRHERSPPARSTNYERRDQYEVRSNQQDKKRMYIHANKHKQRRLRYQDRDVQSRNGYRHQDHTGRNYRKERERKERGERNQNWDIKVHDRKDRRDRNWDTRYGSDWERVDRYDVDSRGNNNDRRDLDDWLFRVDQNQDYDRHYQDDDRADDEDDDDDDDNDRRYQDYERNNRQQRQRDYRYNQNQYYTRSSDKDLENEQTRRFLDYTERLRIQGNQNNHWLQYTFTGDDFPKKNYNLQFHRFDIIQPGVKHQEIEPRVLPYQDEPWNRNKIIPTENIRDNENEKEDHFLEALKLLDRSRAIVLKTVHNDSSDSNQSLEILNVLDSLADQGICNPSEAHYDWIYSTAVPIAIAEVKMQPNRVAEKIKRKVDLSHMAIAELRDLIETVAGTLCQGELPDYCNVIIGNAIIDSPSKEILDRQLVYLKHISTLARIFADLMPEYAEAATSNNVMGYFNVSRARTWPLVNQLIRARIDAGAAQKRCQY